MFPPAGANSPLRLWGDRGAETESNSAHLTHAETEPLRTVGWLRKVSHLLPGEDSRRSRPRLDSRENYGPVTC